MTDPQNQEAYRKTLQDSLEEIEDYLTKTEESAVLEVLEVGLLAK